MQQIGTDIGVSRRASQSPAPRPVLKAASRARSARSRLPRRRAGLRSKSWLQTLAVGVVGLVVLLVFAGLARPIRSPAPALAEIERLADTAGFGLSQISLTGHRYTLDSDIFDAVDLEGSLTLLSFDSRAAKQRIERLPWVEKASIERVIPDRLEIRITERTPVAMWRLGSRNFLIDKTGRVLGAVPADTMPALPRVVGEGAAAETAALLALLAHHPVLASRIEAAERVGARRWMLRLTDGSAIQLPGRGKADAVERAQQVAAALGGGPNEIDVRVPGRTLVRPAQGGKTAMGPQARGAGGAGI